MFLFACECLIRRISCQTFPSKELLHNPKHTLKSYSLCILELNCVCMLRTHVWCSLLNSCSFSHGPPCHYPKTHRPCRSLTICNKSGHSERLLWEHVGSSEKREPTTGFCTASRRTRKKLHFRCKRRRKRRDSARQSLIHKQASCVFVCTASATPKHEHISIFRLCL